MIDIDNPWQSKAPIIILINGIPYFFQRSWVLFEEFELSNRVTMPVNKDNPPIITPVGGTVTLSMKIPIDNPGMLSKCLLEKGAIRTTQKLFATSNIYYAKTDETKKVRTIDGQRKEVEVTLPMTGAQDIKIPFSSLNVPWQIQVSCAYVGISINMACCTLDVFNVDTEVKDHIYSEIWTLRMTEYNVQYVSEQIDIQEAKTNAIPGRK